MFKKYNPHYPFNARFYDKEYELKFHDEKQTGTLAGLFAGLTIFIACLGLSAGSMSTAIAFITVSFQAIKAAIANPVKSLRTE